jgi:hypothetical protein
MLVYPGQHVFHGFQPLGLKNDRLDGKDCGQRWAKLQLSTFDLHPGGGVMGFRDKYVTSVLCKPEQSSDQYPSTGRTATLCRIVICTSVNTTWHTAGLIHDFLERAEPSRLFLLGTNITQIENNKMQAASIFTFSPVQLYSTCN